ncbi:MAG TPA: type II and III secretion system protein family protein [Stellaceae bacterium]|nr:type II and III secretion system protein family protein [Stellaceae bacterium]
MRLRPLASLAGSLILLALTGTSALAQPRPSTAGQGLPPGVQVPTHVVPANGRPIVLEVDKGTLVELAQPASTVFVANPDIADVQVKSPKLIYITAKAPGETVIYAVGAEENVLLNAPIRVSLDLSQLRQSLTRLVPGASISADSVGSNLVLSGSVASAGQAEKVRALATTVATAVKGGQVINRLSVETPNQVSLRVRIAEVDRNILKQIGVDWTKFGPNNEVQFVTTNNFSPRNILSVSPGSTTIVNGAVVINPGVVTTAIPTSNFLTIGMFPFQAAATVEALATEGFITILAEPNLIAMSGQTASFLAGGEYPIPVVQSVAAGTAPTISVQFQQYGVQLAFTPTIIDANHVNLRVRPEVSQLDYSNAVTENGFTIPALTVRRAETSIELGSGQSFALAGLLMHNTSQNISKIPWLGDLPVIGALFRSTKFQNNESELVIIVTPYLVKPSSTELASPTQGFTPPHDVQQVLFGDKWQQGLPAPARGPIGAGGKGLIGPGGLQLN